jgi:regulator of replication initiation timing
MSPNAEFPAPATAALIAAWRERDELRRDVEQHFVRNNELRAENEALRAALAGVVGLVELVSSRDDLPTGLDDLMRLSHRMTDAYAALREGK